MLIISKLDEVVLMRLYILILICLPGIHFAQGESKSKYEKRWAITHPFAALRVKKIYNKALPIYKDADLRSKLDTYESGGRTDAFRHVFFMAAFTQKIKIKKIRKLGIAHEKANKQMYLKGNKEFGSLPDSMDTVMDLYNNEVGFTIGSENKKSDLTELSLIVLSYLNQGKALMIKRNRDGQFVSCTGKILDAMELRKWVNEKCLVTSDRKE